MKKPRSGIAKKPRDLEKFLCIMVDEINALKAATMPDLTPAPEPEPVNESEVQNEIETN